MSLRRRTTVQDDLLGGGAPRQQNLGTRPPRRRNRAPLIHPKYILRLLGFLCLLGLLVFGSLALTINTEGMRPKMEAALSAATGRNVAMKTLQFSVRSLSLIGTDLTISEDASFGGHVPFLQATNARFGVRIAPLIFSRDPVVTAVTLDDPIVMLRQDAAGTWNYYSLLKGSSKSITELDPPAIEVTRGRLSISFFGDDAHPIRLRDLQLSSSALSLQMNNPFTLAGGLEGGGTFKVEGRAGPLDWDSNGPLVPMSGLLHAANVNLADSNLVSSSPSIGGQVSFDTSIESDGRLLRLDGQAKANKLKMAAAGAPASDPLQMVFTVAHDLNAHSGMVNRCELRVTKGTAIITGKYASGGLSPLVNLELTISDAPVTNLAPFLPALGFPLPAGAGLVGGTIVAKVKLDGALEGPYVTGNVTVHGARLSGFDLSSRLTNVEGLDASDLNNEFEIVRFNSALKTGGAGLSFENLEVAVAGLGLLNGVGTIAPDSRLDFNMSGVRGLTGPKGLSIPFTVRGTCASPEFKLAR